MSSAQPGNAIKSDLSSLTLRVAESRRAQPRAKEREVLDVATAYFLEHGYQGASINAMARSAGISKESIYRYFSSKKELFEAVIARELVEYQEQLRQHDSTIKSMDLRDALIVIAETALAVITTDRALALRRLVFEEATRSPEVGHHYYQIGPEQACHALETIFATHCADSDFEPVTLARHFCAMVTWETMLERECAIYGAPTKLQTRAHVESVVHDFLKAFLR